MKLYYTRNSPYARICRIAMRESGLADQVEEIEAVTRNPGTDYFAVTPLARVPALVHGATLIADTRDICAHFDALTGHALWFPPETAESRTQRHIAMGFLDGVAVWLRENGRAAGEKSKPVMEYEEHRARIALGWLNEFGPAPDHWNFTTLVVTAAVDIARNRGMSNGWGEIAPLVMKRADAALKREAFIETSPSL